MRRGEIQIVVISIIKRWPGPKFRFKTNVCRTHSVTYTPNPSNDLRDSPYSLVNSKPYKPVPLLMP